MQNKIGDRQRLVHILEAIKEIETYTSSADLEKFTNNSMMHFASIKQMEIIGEAANCISETARLQFSQIQWKQIIG